MVGLIGRQQDRGGQVVDCDGNKSGEAGCGPAIEVVKERVRFAPPAADTADADGESKQQPDDAYVDRRSDSLDRGSAECRAKKASAAVCR